ncbi:MAG: transporter substrate-binding domain-containing protein, partial [Nitrospina sp.]|nr:transporter substrate-binding domain-containing protein [Nitrospina sp.]
AWLDTHPVITVHNELNWPPFNYNVDGEPAGLSIDYMNLLASRTGIKVKYISGEWGELLDQAFNKKLDVMLNIVKTPERQKHLLYTDSYVKNPNVIIAGKESSISNTQSLFGKKVAYTEGFFYDEILKTAFPEIIRVPMKDTLETLKAVQFGKVDAALGELAVVNYLIRENFLTGLAVKGTFESGNPEIEELNIAVRNDWPILAAILDKALLSITPDERRRLRERWISSGAGSQKVVNLTDEEKDWLDQHPVIRVHNETASPPFSFAEHGRPKGFSVDYMRLLAEKTGLDVEFVTGPSWDEFMAMMKAGELDVMTNIAKTPERQEYLAFTAPYVTLTHTLYTRKDFPRVTSIEDLYGKRIAVPKGFYIAELLKKYPQVEVVEVRDVVEAIHAVSVGKADALYDIMPAVNYLMNKHQITNLKVGGDMGIEAGRPMPLHLAVPKKDDALTGILSKGMAQITDEEFQGISDKWLGSAETARTNESPDKVPLTNAEKKWLEKHKELRLGADSAWPPYDFFDASGKQRGVAADVIALLSKRLDITFDLLPNLTWTQVLEAGRDRRLDVISILIKTPTREKYLKFSKPLLNSPYVIVTNKNFRSVKNLGDMTKDKVAMAKDFAIVELSRKAFPDLNIITVKTPLAGLEAVMSNQVDVYVDNLGVVAYLIEQNGLTSLKIAAQAGVKSQPFHIGVRSDWPELVSIINKGLESITKAEMNAILNKWIPITMSAAKSESDLPLSFGKLLGYAGATLIAIILLALVFLKLSKQESMLAGFGSRRFRSIVIAGLCFFVLVVGSLGWFALTRIKSAVLQGVEQNLKRVLLISEEGLGVWEADRKAFMKQLGRDPELVRLVEELLMISPNPESLLTSKALEEVRHYFKNNKDIFSNIGFFIISPQDISIGSMRNSNVGTRNLIVDKYPGLIQKALDGQVNFVPAMESDVQLKEVSDSKQKRKPPTMFFIGPIQNSTGKTIAAMTLRVDPLKDFSKILGMLGRKGTEGTYAFDASGRLVTDTKFDTQLREIGLIDKDQTAALNLEIRDPGGNMLEGHHPASERSSLPLTRAAAGAIALKAGMEAAGATFGHSNIQVDISGYPDYRGVPVCGAWVWDKNLELGIAAEIGFDEALSNYFRVRFIILTVLGLTLVLFVCSTLFVLAMGERTHKSLTEAKDTLEDKVEERTAELKDKQEELQAA